MTDADTKANTALSRRRPADLRNARKFPVVVTLVPIEKISSFGRAGAIVPGDYIPLGW
jgi:hypothetical protein